MKRAFAALLALFVFRGLVSAVRQEGMEAPKPGKEHELLKQFAGTWDLTVKMANPQDPSKPMEGKAVETAAVGCNGLWLIFDSKGDFAGAPFHGHGVIGYDTSKKKFVGTWVDSMATYMMLSEGTVDESGKVFTFTSEMQDPNGKSIHTKEVHTIKSKDEKTSVFSMKGQDGKDHEMMTIEYKKKK